VSVGEELRAALVAALRPDRVEIVDESARHHGHAGWREGGETHFRVLVVAGCFVGLSRIERQRLVHGAAAALLRERIHALSITALAPGESAAAGTA
jgi:BolA family transcriptional regulator, general stress-responsive regulator